MALTNLQLKEVVCGFIRLIKANAMGAQIVGLFPVTNMRKGTAKQRTEAYNRFFNEKTGEWNVTKRSIYKNVTFQRSYLNSVENRAKDNPIPYEVEAPRGRNWVEGCEGILLVADNDPTKLYLRVSQNKNTTIESTYFVGDREATAEEVEIIKAALPTKTNVCKKQLEYGVSEDNMVIVKDFTLANIVSIKFGDKFVNLR